MVTKIADNLIKQLDNKDRADLEKDGEKKKQELNLVEPPLVFSIFPRNIVKHFSLTAHNTVCTDNVHSHNFFYLFFCVVFHFLSCCPVTPHFLVSLLLKQWKAGGRKGSIEELL